MIGQVIELTVDTNPATLWFGTTWEKIESKFLLATGSDHNLGTTGGSSTVTLSVANLPSHNHSASTASHSHSQTSHYHATTLHSRGGDYANSQYCGWSSDTGQFRTDAIVNTNNAGGETTGSASPVTTIGNTGNGQSFSIMPPYIAVNIWKRTS